MFILHLLFWSSVALLVYTHVGYAALIWTLSWLRPRPPRWVTIEPPISVVIVAHNEASRIEEKLRNLLALDYPQDRLEILIGTDGCTDSTVDRARAFEDAGVKVVAFETRRGKAAVLNDLMAKARGEIVVLADARQRFEAGTVRALVESFGDPRVGAVSGELIFTDVAEGPGVAQGVGFYWRCEKLIRRSESRVSSTVGATGAIYAIRRALFEPILDDTILDDVLIPLRIARRGYRVLFEPRARAYDRVATSTREELTRKIRTIAGNFQLFARERWLLNPFENRLWFQTLSHKGLRLVAPLLLGMALAINFLLTAEPMYRVTLVAQLLFFATALGGYALQNAGRKNPILALSYTVCLFTWATMVGFFRFASGQQHVTWEKEEARLISQVVYSSGSEDHTVSDGAAMRAGSNRP
jgi:cellulose synthase/poly-beta-1,6-N-acetylglucosamine synthase-like glycosyltransferase